MFYLLMFKKLEIHLLYVIREACTFMHASISAQRYSGTTGTLGTSVQRVHRYIGTTVQRVHRYNGYIGYIGTTVQRVHRVHRYNGTTGTSATEPKPESISVLKQYSLFQPQL